MSRLRGDVLDTEATRVDIAHLVRAARPTLHGVWWGDVAVRFDALREVLTFDDDFEVELERVPARVPSTGRAVPGPILARCPRGCGRRARVLWLDPWDSELFLVCRTCAGVRYATATTGSEVERARLAYERLRGRLGLTRPWQSFERRPHERQAAYARRAERLEKARLRLRAAELGRGDQLAARLRSAGG